MNKNLKIFLLVGVVVAVLLLSFFIKPDKGYKKISYNEYKNMTGYSIVYIGENEEILKSFKDLDINKKYNIKHLDYSKLKEEEKKDKSSEIVEIWEDGKLVKDYSFDTFILKDNNKSLVKDVDIDTYYKLKDSDGFHFMLIGREGCSYCQMFTEVINELYNDHKVEIYYLDTDKLDESGYTKLLSSDEYFQGQWGTPTSILYYNGEKIDLIGGYVPKDQLIARLDKAGLFIFLKENKVI